MTRLILLLSAIIFSQFALAAGGVSFPSDWKSWTSVQSPLAQIGALPGCDADISTLPPIYQETVETYCGVRPEGPGAVAILVKPSALESYKKKDGKMADGANLVLQLKDLGLLFVTGHKAGKAMYSVFKEDGTDITAADDTSPLSAKVCRTCHSGYQAFCTGGQCASAK